MAMRVRRQGKRAGAKGGIELATTKIWCITRSQGVSSGPRAERRAVYIECFPPFLTGVS
jgi:hypothetical protein